MINTEKIRKNLIRVEQSEFNKKHAIEINKLSRAKTLELLKETKDLLDNILNNYENNKSSIL